MAENKDKKQNKEEKKCVQFFLPPNERRKLAVLSAQEGLSRTDWLIQQIRKSKIKGEHEYE